MKILIPLFLFTNTALAGGEYNAHAGEGGNILLALFGLVVFVIILLVCLVIVTDYAIDQGWMKAPEGHPKHPDYKKPPARYN